MTSRTSRLAVEEFNRTVDEHMSRSRNLKPGFFKNELLVEQPFEYRLLFAGLWTMADREGLMEDRPTKVKMELFPADNVDVNAGLIALHDTGFILRYEVDGKRYISILAWSKHQNPHHKEADSVIPKPPCIEQKPEALPRCMDEESGAGDQCMEQKPGTSPSLTPENGACEGGATVLIPDSLNLIPDSKSKRTRKRALTTPLPENFSVSDHVKAWAAGKGFDHLDDHCESFKAKCRAKGYTYADWDSAFMEAIREDWAKLRTPNRANGNGGSHGLEGASPAAMRRLA